jgi:hypothetical protein
MDKEFSLSAKRPSWQVLIKCISPEQLTARGIPRHYGPEELAEDLSYARGE